MKRNTLLYIGICALFTLFLTSCNKGDKKKYDEMGDHGKTARTENLQENLKTLHEQGVLFGQMYGTICGVGWENDSLRSDIHSVCGDFTACTGYELSDLRSGTDNTEIPLATIKADILHMAKRGGLSIIRWMMPEPSDEEEQETMVKAMAQYLNSLEDDYGKKAPVVVYLLPRISEEWYTTLPAEEYQDLYNKVREELEDLEVVNAIWGYSFEDSELADQAMTFCPKDMVSIVDVTASPSVAQDQLSKGWQHLNNRLQSLLPLIEQKKLALGITAGDYQAKDSTYWSRTVLPVITSNRLCYALFRENCGMGADIVAACPYPGSSDIADFMKLVNDKRTLFSRKVNGLYLKCEQ